VTLQTDTGPSSDVVRASAAEILRRLSEWAGFYRDRAELRGISDERQADLARVSDCADSVSDACRTARPAILIACQDKLVRRIRRAINRADGAWQHVDSVEFDHWCELANGPLFGFAIAFGALAQALDNKSVASVNDALMAAVRLAAIPPNFAA
jgi:hypothetical protein